MQPWWKEPARRLWFEAALGAASALALALTLVWPDWFERFFEFEPDAGDGSAEWGLAVALAIATLVAFGSAWRDWRLVSKRA